MKRTKIKKKVSGVWPIFKKYLGGILVLELLKVLPDAFVEDVRADKVFHHSDDRSALVVRDGVKFGEDLVRIVGLDGQRVGGLERVCHGGEKKCADLWAVLRGSIKTLLWPIL